MSVILKELTMKHHNHQVPLEDFPLLNFVHCGYCSDSQAFVSM